MSNAASGHDVVIYTDGASSKTGAGGFGGIILDRRDKSTFQFGGGSSNTTNNQMEMCGAIFGLMHAKQVCIDRGLEYQGKILVVSDSQYVIYGITEYIKGWLKNGWISSTGQPVKNQDLWKKFMLAHDLTFPKFQHVRGHRGIMGNEIADQIAKSWKEKAKLQPLDFWPYLNKLFD